MLKNIKGNEFEKEVMGNSRTVLVDFYATWCPPCKMLAPVLEKISTSRADFDIVKVNVDENQDLAVKYKVEAVPTMLVFKEGKPIDKIVGFADESKIADVMSRHV